MRRVKRDSHGGRRRRIQGSNLLGIAPTSFQDSRITVLPTLQWFFLHLSFTIYKRRRQDLNLRELLLAQGFSKPSQWTTMRLLQKNSAYNNALYQDLPYSGDYCFFTLPLLLDCTKERNNLICNNVIKSINVPSAKML